MASACEIQSLILMDGKSNHGSNHGFMISAAIEHDSLSGSSRWAAIKKTGWQHFIHMRWHHSTGCRQIRLGEIFSRPLYTLGGTIPPAAGKSD